MNTRALLTGLRGAMSAACLAAAAAPALAADDAQDLAAANTTFAFNLLNQLAGAQADANVFLSPYSVSTALQMVANGAAGETKAEMQRVLHTGGFSPGALNAACRDLNDRFNHRKEVVLNLANGLWVQQGFALKPAFVDANQRFFQASLDTVDFNSPQSAQAINQWAETRTQGKIRDVVQFPFPPLTRVVLANAIYFKGQWVQAFKKDLTRPREFHPAAGGPRQVPMMLQEGHFLYQENDSFQAVKLRYQGGLQMELYLPATNSNPQKLLAQFAAAGRWPEAEKEFSDREGVVVLPKFKLDYSVTLNHPLEALGLKQAFGPGANFSGMAAQPLFISQVRQKSFVDVNEEGTEAAAVTTITVRSLAVRMPSANRFNLVLDRPFLFVISDPGTGSLLFTGVLNDPGA